MASGPVLLVVILRMLPAFLHCLHMKPVISSLNMARSMPMDLSVLIMVFLLMIIMAVPESVLMAMVL